MTKKRISSLLLLLLYYYIVYGGPEAVDRGTRCTRLYIRWCYVCAYTVRVFRIIYGNVIVRLRRRREVARELILTIFPVRYGPGQREGDDKSGIGVQRQSEILISTGVYTFSPSFPITPFATTIHHHTRRK